jgi:hypothetical protein
MRGREETGNPAAGVTKIVESSYQTRGKALQRLAHYFLPDL